MVPVRSADSGWRAIGWHACSDGGVGRVNTRFRFRRDALDAQWMVCVPDMTGERIAIAFGISWTKARGVVRRPRRCCRGSLRRSRCVPSSYTPGRGDGA